MLRSPDARIEAERPQVARMPRTLFNYRVLPKILFNQRFLNVKIPSPPEMHPENQQVTRKRATA